MKPPTSKTFPGLPVWSASDGTKSIRRGAQFLSNLLRKNLAYHAMVMPDERAKWLAEQFVAASGRFNSRFATNSPDLPGQASARCSVGMRGMNARIAEAIRNNGWAQAAGVYIDNQINQAVQGAKNVWEHLVQRESMVLNSDGFEDE